MSNIGTEREVIVVPVPVRREMEPVYRPNQPLKPAVEPEVEPAVEPVPARPVVEPVEVP